MKKYSQNDEDLHIVNYFKDFKGTLLSVGENDGKTFSNSLRLIELGWQAVLVEPSPSAFKKIQELHSGTNNDVFCVRCAIGNESGKMVLHESGSHLKDKSDFSLLSTLKECETEKWKRAGVEFNEIEVDVITFSELLQVSGFPFFNFITIDAEGVDIDILKQIDLKHVQLICIEWNSIQENKIEILNYTKQYGVENIIYQSGENLLIGR